MEYIFYKLDMTSNLNFEYESLSYANLIKIRSFTLFCFVMSPYSDVTKQKSVKDLILIRLVLREGKTRSSLQKYGFVLVQTTLETLRPPKIFVDSSLNICHIVTQAPCNCGS